MQVSGSDSSVDLEKQGGRGWGAPSALSSTPPHIHSLISPCQQQSVSTRVRARLVPTQNVHGSHLTPTGPARSAL